MATWHTPDTVRELPDLWRDSSALDDSTLSVLLDVAREQVIAYAPALNPTTEPANADYALAPDEDNPVVSTFAWDHWTNTTNIPGSDGWVRERRAGAAETAVGAAQASSASALDLTGSTRFRYYGAPTVPSNPGNGNFVSTDLLPGGTPQSTYWPLTLDFITSSPVVDFRINVVSTGGEFGRILVNGKPISDRSTRITSPPNAGADAVVRLQFPDARRRRIQVFGLNYRGRWGGVAVAGGYTVSKPPAPKRTVAFIGDSHTRGAGAGAELVMPGETFIHATAWALGGDAVIGAGIGGTGFVALNGGGASAAYSGRVADVLAMAPDVVVVSGGANDDSNITSAATAVLNALKGVPEVYAFPTARQNKAERRSELQAACVATGTRYLDVDLTGLPTISDGVHLTHTGHQLLANQIASALLTVDTIPTNYAYAQLRQAQNIWNAGRVGADGGIGDGSDFVMRPLPLDWHVKQVLRPKVGRPRVR